MSFAIAEERSHLRQFYEIDHCHWEFGVSEGQSILQVCVHLNQAAEWAPSRQQALAAQRNRTPADLWSLPPWVLLAQCPCLWTESSAIWGYTSGARLDPVIAAKFNSCRLMDHSLSHEAVWQKPQRKKDRMIVSRTIRSGCIPDLAVISGEWLAYQTCQLKWPNRQNADYHTNSIATHQLLA